MNKQTESIIRKRSDAEQAASRGKGSQQGSMIKTLSRRSFRNNKRRNLVAVLAIILTTMMFTTLFTLAQSLGRNMTEMYLRQSGTTAHTSTKSITDEEIEKIAAHPLVVHSGYSIILGNAQNTSLAGRQVEIRYASDQYARDSFAWPETGRMPEAEDEIALDTLTLQRLGVTPELGATITLEWQKDITSPEMTSSTFTLCGIWEGNESSYASTAWVSKEFALNACDYAAGPSDGQVLGTRMMGVTFADSDDIEGQMTQVLSDTGITDVEFSTNLAYDAGVQQSIFMENLSTYAGMLLVFLAGYLIIYNVFQISVASDIQFYGRLKTLGTTRKQIKKIIRGQANRLSLIGIPVGLVIGYLLGIVLVPVMIGGDNPNTIVSTNPIIFIGSAVFAYVTVLCSSLLPARRAGKVSPMEALRYTDADTSVKKKQKKSKKGASIAGMAWSNLWRNKKRTVMVICSLTLGLVLMSYFYASNASFDMDKYLMDLTVADFQIDDATNSTVSGYDPASNTISESLLSDIQSLDTLEAEGRLYSQDISMPLSEEARNNFSTFYTQDVLDEYASFDPSFPMWKEVFDSALAGNAVPHTIYGADGLILDAAASENYILDGSYDPEKFATGDYVLAIGPAADPQTGLPTYSVGEEVNINGRNFTVMAVLSPLQPMVSGYTPVFSVQLVMQADVFTEMWPDNNLRKYYFNVEDAGIDEASDMLTEYQQSYASGMSITSRQTMAQQYEDERRSSSVIGYSISVVIALVGILNFVNSMVTAIISRRREFAMIQSIGMTKRQLRKMLIFEGLYYAGITLVISYILSIFTVGVIVRALTAGGYTTFQFTLLPLIICTPVLLIFAVLLPYLCFRNLEKDSIVERLRATD